MVTATRAVHPALRGLVAGPLVAYDMSLPVTAVHVGLPSTAATVIIAVDDPLDVGWLDDPRSSARRWCSISGLHLRPALIRTHGLQRGIHVAVTPAGCRALFGAPVGEVAGLTVDLAEVPRGLTAVEHEMVVEQPSWAARLRTVERLLLARLRSHAPAPDLLWGWDLLTAGARVEDAARELGWSRRHLSTRVRSEFGLTPKEIGRLARFERAHGLVLAGTPLAEAAHVSGYADQSHLSREWKAFAGRSPSASGDDFPNLHDLVPGSTPC